MRKARITQRELLCLVGRSGAKEVNKGELLGLPTGAAVKKDRDGRIVILGMMADGSDLEFSLELARKCPIRPRRK